jgi:hypothetical protein
MTYVMQQLCDASKNTITFNAQIAMLQAEKDQAVDLLHQQQSEGLVMRSKLEDEYRQRNHYLTQIDNLQKNLNRFGDLLEMTTKDSEAGKQICGTTMVDLHTENDKLTQNDHRMMNAINQMRQNERSLLVERDQLRNQLSRMQKPSRPSSAPTMISLPARTTATASDTHGRVLLAGSSSSSLRPTFIAPPISSPERVPNTLKRKSKSPGQQTTKKVKASSGD